MKTDWPEIAWLCLFCATAVVGVIGLLPTSDQVSTKDWIEALGGWGAALVVIPSLILLLRQNSFAEEQSRQARSTALMARAEALRYEYKFASDVINALGEYDLDAPNIALVHQNDANGYSAAVITSIRKFRRFVTDAAYESVGLSRQNPNNKLTLVRESFLDGLVKIEDFLKDFHPVLEKLAMPGTTEADMVASLKAYHKTLHHYETTQAAIEGARNLQEAVSHELGETQRELNRLSGLH